VVGEDGPELFVPGQSGVVYPNGATGGGAGVGGPTDVHVYLHMEPAGVVKMVRKEVRTRGGNVQVVLGAA
jgi:hypothetical protein